MRQLYFLRPLMLLLLASGGCQVMKPAGGPDNTDSYCLPPPPFDAAKLPQLSAYSRRLARAYGLEPALLGLAQLPPGGGASPIAYQTFVRRRQALVAQVAQAAGEAARVAEELECEKQRVDQTALALQGQQTKQTRNFTLGSLLAGAASGIFSATIRHPDQANLNLVLTVSTAALSAGLGVATLFVNPRTDYPLPNNLLADVWDQRPQPAFYPPGLWATLNETRNVSTDPHGPSPLQTIRQRWARYDQLTGGKPAQQAQRQELYFGKGGGYHLDDLHVRSEMLLQVAVAVRIVNQDLQKLLAEISAFEPQ